MESFFFIPGNRLHKLEDIRELNASEIIIDLEDAVKASERKAILKDLVSTEKYKDFYIRIPLYRGENTIDVSILIILIKHGFKKFVFPKIRKIQDFEQIYSAVGENDVELILLIETPRFFIEIKDILLRYERIIKGIGIGSHDFMTEVGGQHNLKNLEYVRQQLLYLARMINAKAIDIASMELQDKDDLITEILDGFEKGYDAKFYIHPWQLQVKNNMVLYSEAEYEWALKVTEELNRVGSSAEFNPIIIDEKVIERPHLIRAEKIIDYYATK